MEGNSADHAVLDILVVFKVILVGIKFFNVLPHLKLDGARTKRCGIVVFHQAALSIIERPAGYRDLRHDLDLNIVFCKLGDFHGEVLHLGVCRRCLVRLGGLGLHDVQIPFYGFCAGEAARIVAAHGVNARSLFTEVNVDEMRAVFARNPLVVAVVRLHVVAVLFLDKLAFYAEVGNNILVSSIKNILIDLVHPNVALLYLLLGHDAVSAGSCRICLAGRSIRLRNTFSDGIRHRLACVNQRQIPVGIPVGIRIFLHVFPIKTPRAQINVIVEFVIAVFIVAADTDHIIVVQKTGVNDPIGMLQCYVCKPATLGHHRAVLAGSGFTQTDLRGSHRVGSRVVLIPKLDCACVVCV